MNKTFRLNSGLTIATTSPTRPRNNFSRPSMLRAVTLEDGRMHASGIFGTATIVQERHGKIFRPARQEMNRHVSTPKIVHLAAKPALLDFPTLRLLADAVERALARLEMSGNPLAAASSTEATRAKLAEYVFASAQEGERNSLHLIDGALNQLMAAHLSMLSPGTAAMAHESATALRIAHGEMREPAFSQESPFIPPDKT